MALRRGFKAEAERTTVEIRQELRLGDADPLDPWALAELLDIPVWALSEYTEEHPQCVQCLGEDHRGNFHAMMVIVQDRRVIVHNDFNSEARQRSDIAHECAHALLHHKAQEVTDGTALEYDQDQEDEAGWLSAKLLLPDRTCLAICRQGTPASEAAATFGVSTKMMSYRLGASGAITRVRRERAKRGA